MPDLIQFNEEICRSLDQSQKLEWLETNGLGGFASSTVAGANTRRYHGLLIASLKPPVERYVLLSKLEETLVLRGERIDLSTNFYPGSTHPNGYRFLKHFRLDPFPIFTFQVDGIEIEKRVFMVQGENTTVVEYEVHGLDPVALREAVLEIRPLIAFRDYHSTTHANDNLNAALAQQPGTVSVQPYQGLPALHLAHTSALVSPEGHWYRNFEYPVEIERGLDSHEDLFCPYSLSFDLKEQPRVALIASTQPQDAADAPSFRQSEIDRRARIRARFPSGSVVVQDLAAAADQFIVQRGDLQTIVAGYHWFSDWGRDTMIALPGLTLVTGRFEIARQILRAFAGYLDQGMLPNCFPGAGEQPEYNTIDATLWFFEAVRSYLHYTGDMGFVKNELYVPLKSVLDWHMRGTRYGIHLDSDGLLAGGEPGVQLTWMDAKIGDWVVTPRRGKAVEIQALWYNALRVMQFLAAQFNDSDIEILLRGLADCAHASFDRIFWNQETGCLYDAIDGDCKDGSVRPNQLIALSLHHPLISGDKARQVLGVVERELLTPYGLRTLSPHDSRYAGRYAGSPSTRDAIYHQGTVWPWLLGPFISAYVRAHDGSPEARAQAAQWVEGFHGHLRTAGLGQISEILDGDQPYEPRGCIAQAWSVAEILRAAVEDVYQMRNKTIQAAA